MKKTVLILSMLLAVIVLAPLSASAYTFIRNLQQGSVGPDVLELQKVLNLNTATKVSQTGAGSPGQETSFFGQATRKAVITFQELYRSEILVPAGLSQGNGFVGSLTRQKLNAVSSGVVVATTTATTTSSATVQTPQQSLLSTVPIITGLSTTTLGNGDKLVVYGKNFQNVNTVMVSIELPGKYANLSTASSTSIEFTFNNTTAEALRQQFSSMDSQTHDFIINKIRTEMNKQSPSADGNWYFPATLYVVNANGTSNAVSIKINLLKGV